MQDRTDVLDRMAQRLREARAAKGLSLDAVSKLSGVSRSMVSQIERGESSPTVATLWNLTQALQVDFAGLLEQPAPDQIEVLRDMATPTIEGRGKGCRIRILSPAEEAGKHELYELKFDDGGALESDAHGPGARENLTVIEGQVTIVSGGTSETLGPGDTARYPADRDHAIRAAFGPARAFLVVRHDG